MADEASEEIVAPLNKIVTIVDQSANMRKDLKKNLPNCNLRNLFTEIKGIIDEKTRLSNTTKPRTK
jgi:hypothetical protein